MNIIKRLYPAIILPILIPAALTLAVLVGNIEFQTLAALFLANGINGVIAHVLAVAITWVTAMLVLFVIHPATYEREMRSLNDHNGVELSTADALALGGDHDARRIVQERLAKSRNASNDDGGAL